MLSKNVTTFRFLNLFKKLRNLKFENFDPLRMITVSCFKREQLEFSMERGFQIRDVAGISGVNVRTFALIVCAQRCCAGNATVICHASLRLTGLEDKHGVENAGEKSHRFYSFGSSVTPIFLIMNHLLYLLSTKYDRMKKISP